MNLIIFLNSYDARRGVGGTYTNTYGGSHGGAGGGTSSPVQVLYGLMYVKH